MYLGERTWTEIPDLTDRVVVVPLGSLEQHGHHLPLLTDTMIGTEIARRAEAELGDQALFLPMLWLGASNHHRTFPGTVSLGNELYVRVLCDLLESLIAAGFRRIYLLTAHGGNVLPGNMAIHEVQLRHRDMPDLWLALSSWWSIAAAQVAALPQVEQPTVTHACELETSMILRLRPDLVHMDAARGASIPFTSAFYVPDFHSPSRMDVARSFEQLSATGAFGHPEIATAEKGEALYAAAVAEIVAFVRDFATWQPIVPQ
jgi:creatinine amidohydrolase